MSLKTEKIMSITVPAEVEESAIKVFEEELDELLRECPDRLNVDCSGLVHVSSSHVKLLLRAQLSCSEYGGRVRLQSPSQALVQVLEVLDLYDMFDEAVTGKSKLDESNSSSHRTSEAGTFQTRFVANPQHVKIALEEFQNYLTSLELATPAVIELRTIFYEVVTNIQNHAKLEKTDTIEFTARSDGSKLVLVFEDHGVPFNLAEQLQNVDIGKAIKQRLIRGFGTTLIKRLVDKITYVRQAGNANVLTLERFWSR